MRINSHAIESYCIAIDRASRAVTRACISFAQFRSVMGSVFLSACALVLALQAAAGPARAQDALATVEPPPSVICGLEGFQLDTLQL